jgi:hypothetical protein
MTNSRGNRVSQLAKKVMAIKDRRCITYSKIAAECGGIEVGMVAGRISGLVNCHAIRPDLEPHVQAWVRRQGL